MSLIGERYAESFLMIADEEDKIVELKKEADAMVDIFDDDVLDFLRNSGISKRDKKEVLFEAFKELDPDFRYLFALMIDTGRAYYIKDALKQFIKLANQKLGIQEVIVYSASKLDDNEKKKIQDALVKKLDKEVYLKNIIDKNIIAGVKIDINNRLYDSSLETKINNLQTELLKEIK